MPNWKKVIVSGSNAELKQITGSTFLVDGNQSGNFIALIDNDQNSNGHVLKLASDGTGNGSYLLDMENGNNTMFRARADGRFAFGNSAVGSMGAGTFVVGIDGGHSSDIAISKRLQHLGDSDTYIDFETNKTIFSAGGNLLDYTTTKFSGSAVTTASFGHLNIAGAVELKEGGGNTVITYPAVNLGGDTECEIKIGDVDSATTGTFLSIKPVDEQISVGNADLLVNDIVHQGDTDTKISFTTDQIQFKVGNANMLTLAEDSTDTVTFLANTIEYNGNISGSSTSTGSFGRVEASSIGGNSPLIIESDNFNVDAQGNLSIATNATASIGTVSATVDVPATGFIRSRRFRGRSPIAFETEGTRIEVTGSILATGAVTASGDISGSLSTTGSLGKMVIGSSNLSKSGSSLLEVKGNQGTLFSVSDEMSGSIFSANTVAGIPVIEAFSDQSVSIGPAGSPFTINSSGEITTDISSSASVTASFGHLIINKDAHIGEDLLADGDVVAYNSSDERLKDNLQVIEGALDKIDGIHGYEFDWNDKSPSWAQERGHDVGVVAQEVQKIQPELVEQRSNGYLGVDYKRLVPLLIQSIKELKEEVEEIKQKCDCLNK